MVDIVSHATVAAENDAVLKRQNSSSASSNSPNPSNFHKVSRLPSESQDSPSPAPAPELGLEITKLKHLNAFVYKLIDKKTGEVVRQWPTQQMVEMKEYIAEQQIQLLDEKA